MSGLRHSSMQAGWIDSEHRELPLGDFGLESGESIRDFRLSYVLHGVTGPVGAAALQDAANVVLALPAAGVTGPVGAAALQDAANVVLALPAVASTHHRLDFLIGEGKALDPQGTVVIAVDAIGNGLTTSPSTSTLQPGTAFPAFTIRDMVASQLALIDHLGIGRLKAVIGASMGGMQALQWAVSHGDRIERLVAMTPMARTTPWSAAINETARRALLADPTVLAADVMAGAAVDVRAGSAAGAAMVGGWAAWVPLMQLIAGRTPQQVDQAFTGAADVIDWIRYRTDWWQSQHFAAVDWLYQSRAYDAHDVGTSPGFWGDTARALQSVSIPALVLAPALDLYNPADAARYAASQMPGARFVEIPSVWGHQAASMADPAAAAFLNRTVAGFLAYPVTANTK